MRILFINTGPWGTGSFTSIKGLAKELIKLGHEVKISFPDANFESIDKDEYYSNTELYHIWQFPIKNQQIEIPTFPLMITDPHPRNPNAITFKSLSDQQIQAYEQALHTHIAELVNSFQPDIIECHHIWYSSWVASQMGLNYIVTAHHSDQLGFMFDERAQRKAIAGAQAAQKIIAISDFVKQEVMDLYHVDEKKIIVMENGYDKDIFFKKYLNKKVVLQNLGINISDDALIVNFAGKLSATKGFDILLQANRLLDPAMNIHFIVMGTGNLDELCHDLDPDSYSLKNVHFVGHQHPENVADIHNISLLSVMPSRSEGFGIAALEAMGCGIPVVATRSGGPEFFSVGRIIDIESPQQLADGIMEILKMPSDEYDVLCKQALATAEKLSMTAITQKHLALYRSILEKSAY
jgi:glycosyltransferase involved in cell wall biosynthesis